MGGTRAGGLKCAEKNKEQYGKTFYQRIGRLGGSTSHGKKRGFAANPELAKKAGEKGGRMGQRGAGSYTKTMIEPIADKITQEYENGSSLLAIAKKHDLSYGALCRWARANIDYKALGEK